MFDRLKSHNFNHRVKLSSKRIVSSCDFHQHHLPTWTGLWEGICTGLSIATVFVLCMLLFTECGYISCHNHLRVVHDYAWIFYFKVATQPKDKSPTFRLLFISNIHVVLRCKIWYGFPPHIFPHTLRCVSTLFCAFLLIIKNGQLLMWILNVLPVGSSCDYLKFDFQTER